MLDIAEDEAAETLLLVAELEPLDDAILEENRFAVVSAAFEELEYRQHVLGEAYPFAVEMRALILNDDPILQPGQVVYLFCLLASAIRERKLHPVELVEGAARNIANAFQICACLAAGGFVQGDVASFGFPPEPVNDFETPTVFIY